MMFTVPGFNQSGFVLGVNQDKGELYMPFQVDEGPNGNIYAFDAKDAFIKIYSPSGKYINRMGGRGEGPGEILVLGQFSFFNADLLLFTEYIMGHRWITFMDLSGDFKNVLKLDLKGNFGIRLARKSADNKLIAEFHSDMLFDKVKGKNYYGEYYNRKLAIVNTDGKIEKELIKKIHLFSIKSGDKGAFKRIPFFPGFLWDLTSDNKIIFSDGCTNILKIYSTDGNIIEEIKTLLPDAPRVTDADLKKWKREFKENVVKTNGIVAYNRYFKAIIDYTESIYKKKPVYMEIAVTPDNNILVRGDEENGKENRKYWLLDQKGKILVYIESKAKSIKISKNFVLYIIEDDDGEYVRCQKKQHSEKDSLASTNKVIIKKEPNKK